MVTLDETTATEEQYQLATYKKMPVVAERGEGVWIYASDGERYLDLYGGHAVAGTGHCHPHVVKAIREQTEKLLFYSNLVYSEARARAAQKLVSIAPSSLTDRKSTRLNSSHPSISYAVFCSKKNSYTRP